MRSGSSGNRRATRMQGENRWWGRGTTDTDRGEHGERVPSHLWDGKGLSVVFGNVGDNESWCRFYRSNELCTFKVLDLWKYYVHHTIGFLINCNDRSFDVSVECIIPTHTSWRNPLLIKASTQTSDDEDTDYDNDNDNDLQQSAWYKF